MFNCFFILKKLNFSFYIQGCLIAFLTLMVSPAYTKSSNTGYKNIIKNYFLSRKPNNTIFYGAPRSLSLFAGTSLSGESKDGDQRIFSSRILGFNQRIKEFSTTADLNLKTEWHSMQLESERVTQIRITPHLSLPDIRSGFPVYVGAGLGLGFFPSYIFKKEKAFSLSSEMYAGLRLLDVYKNFGLITELNLKMHIPFQDKKLYTELLINVGCIFSF